MANPAHVEVARGGAKAILDWRGTSDEVSLDLFGAELSGVDLTRAYLNDADLRGANLTEARLDGSSLTSARLSRANLRGASLKDVSARQAQLLRASLMGASLVRSNLSFASLTGADLRAADLSGAMLMGGTLDGADLRGAILSGASLRRVDLSKTDLRAIDASAADFRGATIADAKLAGANCFGADFSGAKFIGAILDDANFQRANICASEFVAGSFARVNFDAALCGATRFSDADLSAAIGLEWMTHIGSSTIGVDTLYKSMGKLPASFMEGCGIPDALIAYLPSLLGAEHAIEFYSCFISHSHRDEEFTKRLFSKMRDHHLRTWYAPEDMKAGQKIHYQVEQAIRLHDKLLLVLSETSMTSEWVNTEIYHAMERERREGKRVLFPISLVPFERIQEWKAFDADTGRDMAREIREYFIPDFSNWKDHDAFEVAFERLLRDLKAGDGVKAETGL